MATVLQLHVLLGANGDLCVMLPYLREESLRLGRRVPLLVAKGHAAILEGVSYVEPVVFEGTWHDLPGALRFLREELPEQPVKVLQFYGLSHERAMRSWLDEMWYLSGAWQDFEAKPLVFDKRDEGREARLWERMNEGARSRSRSRSRSREEDGEKPVILVGLKGVSSPFPWAWELMRRIRGRFGRRCRIVDLARVKAVRPHDLLGLYERAALLVSIDTMHLHLSKAAPGLPVIALARDMPSLWHGTPWRPHFAFHCRYGEWDRRWEEMAGVIERAVQGPRSKVQSPKLEPILGLPRFAYNPCVLAVDEKGDLGRVVARHHPNGSWRTKLSVDGMPVVLRSDLGRCSHEDARMFRHQGEMMVSLTLAETDRRHRPRCVQAYGQLEPLANDRWSVRGLKIPDHGWNNWGGLEKNWVFFSHDGAVHAIYACHPRHVVLRFGADGVTVVKQWVTKGPRWKWGEIRGGTGPVAFAESGKRKAESGKLWLRLFHSRTPAVRRKGHETRERYHMGALVMEAAPPFRVRAVSRRPILSGDERPVWGCRHWKANVVIPYGAAVNTEALRHGEAEWVVSVGVNDAMACVARVRVGDLDLEWL